MAKKVLLAMSGGIDSTMAALLLLDQGYEIVGVTYRTWDSISNACQEKETGCCSMDAIMEAKRNAERLGIPHHILDLRGHFRQTVVVDFISEYLAGNTPNPCVLCNSVMKWGALIKRADEMDCEFIATGHYARVASQNNRFYLQKGVDESKDQTYFLWTLTQEDLSRTIFPLGEYHKEEVRKMAREKGFESLAKKRESQEICFIPDDDYRRFMRDQVPDLEQRVGEGDFLSTDGQHLGRHKGYPNYTIGQRKGLNVAVGHPLYVVSIDPGKNVVVLGEREDLLRRSLVAGKLNWMKYDPIPEGLEIHARIRYRNPGTKATITLAGNQARVDFTGEVSAVAPGQSVVFYEGDDVVGGGFILA